MLLLILNFLNFLAMFAMQDGGKVSSKNLIQCIQISIQPLMKYCNYNNIFFGRLLIPFGLTCNRNKTVELVAKCSLEL